MLSHCRKFSALNIRTPNSAPSIALRCAIDTAENFGIIFEAQKLGFGLNEVIEDDVAEVDFRDSDGKHFDIVRERFWR